MRLSDWFKSLGNRAQGLDLPNLRVAEAQGESGGVDLMELPQIPKPTLKSRATDLLIGKKDAPQPIPFGASQGEDGGYILNSGVSESPRQGGMLRDITGGFKENFNNKASLDNFGQNTLDDGRNKGFAYKLGEGLGTVARFGESPMGRAALTAGAIGAFGGSPLQMAAFGGSAGLQNQQLRGADKLYRNSLNQQGIDTSGVGGYMNDDLYKNVATMDYKNRELQYYKLARVEQQKKNQAQQSYNAQYKQLMANWDKGFYRGKENIFGQELENLNNQYQENIAMIDADIASQYSSSNQTYLAPSKKYMYETAPQVALGNLGLNYAKFTHQQEQDAFDNWHKTQGENKNGKLIAENEATLSNIENGLRLIKENPDAYTYAKGMLPANITNRIDPAGVGARTQIDNITAVYRKWLTGAQMSDQERKAYERFLPAPTDNAHIVEQKLLGMQDAIQRQTNIYRQGNPVAMSGQAYQPQSGYGNSAQQSQKTPQQLAAEELKRRGKL